MLTLLKSLILSKIDYGSVLWSPSKVSEMRRIEQLQSKFTKRIQCPGNENKDYWERLEEFNLYSIQRRFERYRIIYVWKILHGLVVNPGIEFNQNEESRIGITCKIPKYTKKIREDSFMIKGLRLFNQMPKEIREFKCIDPENQQKSTDKFKEKLDKHLSTIPDQPNLSGEYSKRMNGVTLLGERTNSLLRIN